MIDEAALETAQELLAPYRWLLWLMLIGGAIGFLQTTVLYRRTMRGVLLLLRQLQRAVQSLPKNQAADRNKQMIRWYRKNYRSQRLRIFSLVCSVGMILTGLMGLMLLSLE